MEMSRFSVLRANGPRFIRFDTCLSGQSRPKGNSGYLSPAFWHLGQFCVQRPVKTLGFSYYVLRIVFYRFCICLSGQLRPKGNFTPPVEYSQVFEQKRKIPVLQASVLSRSSASATWTNVVRFEIEESEKASIHAISFLAKVFVLNSGILRTEIGHLQNSDFCSTEGFSPSCGLDASTSFTLRIGFCCIVYLFADNSGQCYPS